MPWGLKRYQETGNLHYVTFTSYHRLPFLATEIARDTFERVLEKVRRSYGFVIIGYVVMPERVHLLVSEPARSELSTALQLLNQTTGRKLRNYSGENPFWQKRYYDFNVWTEKKRIEKLRYIHRNPVRRELVQNPEDWRWSSYRHYSTGEKGTVTVGSEQGHEAPAATRGKEKKDELPHPIAKNTR